MPYSLQYKKSVKKELRKLHSADRVIIIQKILLLKDNPRPKGSAKLKGSVDLFRIRHGDYRVVYQILNDVLVIIIIRVGHRREIYKKL
jgi:mRNA interferase RelE/StbE